MQWNAHLSGNQWILLAGDLKGKFRAQARKEDIKEHKYNIYGNGLSNLIQIVLNSEHVNALTGHKDIRRRALPLLICRAPEKIKSPTRLGRAVNFMYSDVVSPTTRNCCLRSLMASSKHSNKAEKKLVFWAFLFSINVLIWSLSTSAGLPDLGALSSEKLQHETQ